MLNSVCNARLAYNQTPFLIWEVRNAVSQQCCCDSQVKKLMLTITGIHYLWDIIQAKLKDDRRSKTTSMQWQTYCQDLPDMVCIFLWVFANLWRDRLLLFFLNLTGTEAGEEEYWGLVQCEISAWLKERGKNDIKYQRYSYTFIMDPFVFLPTVLEINTIIVAYITKE